MVAFAISESQRTNTIGMFMAKICTQQYALPIFGDQKEPVVIYPGTAIVIPVHAIHL